MEIYKELEDRYLQETEDQRNKYNIYSSVRTAIAICFLIAIYFYYQNQNNLLLIPLIWLPVVFLFLVKKHQEIKWKKEFSKQLSIINKEEASFLKNQELPFDDGEEFVQTSHSFAYDLDLFGRQSLFHFLNRTATYIGKNKLAGRLLNQPDSKEIEVSQEAVKELSKQLDWRQEFSALGKMKPDSAKAYNDLIKWSRKPLNTLNPIVNTLAYILPISMLLSLIAYFITERELIGNISFLLFLINLGVLGLGVKQLKEVIIESTEINKILTQYSLILKKIEASDFQSDYLKSLKSELEDEKIQSSKAIKKLSELFTQMDHVSNVLAVLFLDGFFLYHVHVFRSLIEWKNEYAAKISKWLDVIGEVEALNSLANFSYNNPNFAFPTISENEEIILKDAGHPLIPTVSRVSNDVSFLKENFFVLTGSNMSGKSTFLRTLGINMVLTNTGAPVCASLARIHPMPIYVSMRLSDSLSDSESFFFAEVKRLKEIMEHASKQTCFVLLDEILRGTNSDDKRTGTLEVIHKMVEKGAIGVIATHDLEVCNISNEYERLANKCFEVEIENNELQFDYLLRDGICRNKSATFLMKKMEII